MNLEKLMIVLLVIGVMLFLSSLALGFESVAKYYYKQGYLDACKDFYAGSIKYELKEMEDGTRIWEKK